MSSDPVLPSGYISPLTDKQHATLGRIAVLWGQIESTIDFILPHFCDLSKEELSAIGVYDRPMAAKVQFLKTVSKARSAEAVHHKVIGFLTIIENTKVDRNHAFHSMWGWRVDSRKKSVEASARFQKTPEKGLTPTGLNKLERDLVKCGIIGKQLHHLSIGEGPDHNPTRFFHGKPGGPPAWFVQWLERNPVLDQNLDCGPKANQLPRLKAPHPRK